LLLYFFFFFQQRVKQDQILFNYLKESPFSDSVVFLQVPFLQTVHCTVQAPFLHFFLHDLVLPGAMLSFPEEPECGEEEPECPSDIPAGGPDIPDDGFGPPCEAGSFSLVTVHLPLAQVRQVTVQCPFLQLVEQDFPLLPCPSSFICDSFTASLVFEHLPSMHIVHSFTQFLLFVQVVLHCLD
jgi:hypothetical protein